MSSPRLEDFYDTPPPVAELVGGWYDGRRMTISARQGPWLVLPAPLPEPAIAEAADFLNGLPPVPQPLAYRWTGSIRDDGTRVYRFEG